jgi:hypothetical protein
MTMRHISTGWWNDNVKKERAQLVLHGWTCHIQAKRSDITYVWTHPVLSTQPITHEEALMKSATLREQQAVCKVIEAMCREALIMAVETPLGPKRTAELVALHAGIADRLIQEGVTNERASVLAKGIRVDVEVAADELPSPSFPVRS